jgi:hypothetical protein
MLGEETGPRNCHRQRSSWGGTALHLGGCAHQIQDPRGVWDRAGGGHTLSTHCDSRGMTGGGQEGRQHRQGHNHAVGDTRASDGKMVIGRDVPRVLHCRCRLQGRHVRARMAGRQPGGVEQSPPDTHRHIHEMRGRKDCTQGYKEL